MGYKDHKCHSIQTVHCAVLTISNTRNQDTDGSGKIIQDVLEQNGHKIDYNVVIKDDIDLIRAELDKLVQSDEFEPVQAIILNGGTGISPFDVTIEAVTPYLKKILNGFGELFRYLSFKEIGSAAVMSRAVAGITNERKIVIAVPGSVNAVRLAMEKLVIPELGHMVWEVSKGIKKR